MTELLYHTDGYLKVFDAVLVDVLLGDNAVVLDKTAFYPGGGGQPCDVGILVVGGKAFPVRKVQRRGPHIVHFLEGDISQLAKGSPIHGEINWDLRYQLMRTHTALHILCGVIFRDYKALVTGGDMEPLKGRMDFEFETLHADLVQVVENAVNQEVKNARLVQVSLLSRQEAFKIPDLIRTKINLLPEDILQVRVVEIRGLDLQADGGTHVNNTSEVGRIHITDYKSKGKINKRIYIALEQ